MKVNRKSRKLNIEEPDNNNAYLWIGYKEGGAMGEQKRIVHHEVLTAD